VHRQIADSEVTCMCQERRPQRLSRRTSIDGVLTRWRGSYTQMPRRPPLSRRWLTALSWPVGVTLTSWNYMWRTTVMHRAEHTETEAAPHLPPALPAGV